MPRDGSPPVKPFEKGNTLTPKKWVKGVSANPGGKVSLRRDLERAQEIGLLPELHAVLDEWFAEAVTRMAELGPDGFIAGLREAVREATVIDLPTTPEVARAMWWRATLPVSFRGPSGTKDSVWVYANGEVGTRLLGKPKEHVVLEDGSSPPVDWKRVPESEREELQSAMLRLLGHLGEPESPTEH